jgi:hypothetical protein
MCRHSNGIQVRPSAPDRAQARLSLRYPVGRLRTRAAPAHLLMKGLILDSRNTALLKRPLPSPALNTMRV